MTDEEKRQKIFEEEVKHIVVSSWSNVEYVGSFGDPTCLMYFVIKGSHSFPYSGSIKHNYGLFTYNYTEGNVFPSSYGKISPLIISDLNIHNLTDILLKIKTTEG